MKCLLGTAATVPQQILTECLIDSLSPHEAEALRKAMDEVKSKVPAFSQDVMLSLFSVLGRFNIRHTHSCQIQGNANSDCIIRVPQ